MPYKSEAQRKYFHAAMERGDIGPKVVKEFDAASKGKSLPAKMAHGGAVCPACGYAMGGEVEPDEDDRTEPSNLDEVTSDPAEERRRYAFAFLDKRGM